MAIIQINSDHVAQFPRLDGMIGQWCYFLHEEFYSWYDTEEEARANYPRACYQHLTAISHGQLAEYGISSELALKIKLFLIKNHEDSDDTTVLAETCFDHFGLKDEENHPIWEWVSMFSD